MLNIGFAEVEGPGATAGALQKLRVYVEGLWGSQGRPSRARFRGHTPVHSHRKGGGFWVLNIGSAEVEGARPHGEPCAAFLVRFRVFTLRIENQWICASLYRVLALSARWPRATTRITP